MLRCLPDDRQRQGHTGGDGAGGGHGLKALNAGKVTIMYNPRKMLSEAVRSMARVSSHQGPSAIGQMRALLELRSVTGMSRREFYRYRLWRRELTPEAVIEFISLRERRAIEDALNPSPYRDRCQSKCGLATIFASVGMRVPLGFAVFGQSHPGGTPELRHLHTLDEMASAISSFGRAGFVIKPDDGSQGEGVLLFSGVSGDTLTALGGRRMTTAELWTQINAPPLRSWRFEQLVPPHAVLADLCPGFTPTVRALVLLVGGRPVIHAATLKVPMGHVGIDNFSKGNLAAPIDPATGLVGMAVDFEGESRYAAHPITGAPIRGLMVPRWGELIDIIGVGARALAPLTALGWDIVPSPEGPVALEANAAWGQEIVQLPQDRGVVHSAFVELLTQVGAEAILRRRDRALAARSA